MGMFYITETWIKTNGTARMGWTAGQLRVLGVAWPPRKGWLRALVGTAITEEQRLAFEQIGHEHRATSPTSTTPSADRR